MTVAAPGTIETGDVSGRAAINRAARGAGPLSTRTAWVYQGLLAVALAAGVVGFAQHSSNNVSGSVGPDSPPPAVLIQFD